MARWSNVVVFTLALAAATAAAQPTDRLRQILDQQELLATEMRTGVIRLPAADAAVVREQQAAIQRLLDGRVSLDSLEQHERIQLDSALQEINARVVGTLRAAEDRRICKLERTTGSNVRKQTCKTREEWAMARRDSKTWHATPRICIPPGCGEAPGDRIERGLR